MVVEDVPMVTQPGGSKPATATLTRESAQADATDAVSGRNLIAFSIKTKGVRNFARRLWTVFTRFGFSEARTRRSLEATMNSLRRYGSAPTYFIPAVVLRRHRALMALLVGQGAEIGIHGYVHNDFRTLARAEQCAQVERAQRAFMTAGIPYSGFRNPYLGWSEDSVGVFAELGFGYDSNEAAIHEVINRETLPLHLRNGYDKSRHLFQAIPASRYSVRPHCEGLLVRIPVSIPDDEMLYDRLRITNTNRLGDLWCDMLARVYQLEGIYAFNLHPERGVLCDAALNRLLAFAHEQAPSVWLPQLRQVAEWWQARCRFSWHITALSPGRWHVEASSSAHATLLGRALQVEDQPTGPWIGLERRLLSHSFTVAAPTCPCVALSPDSASEVRDFLVESGYAVASAADSDAFQSSLFLDLPEGLGATRENRLRRRSALLDHLEALEAPLLRFGCWPDGHQAAMAITGDIDSITIQDFFLRVAEARTNS
jgi:peptidoglycan/xylan/chitin deacetylase (PgdA/CDA1 family)